MISQKKPIVILDIDQTLFNTSLFKERLSDSTTLDESEYTELLYLTEKKIFQELTIKRNIQINIFSTRKELFSNGKTFNDTTAIKRLKDYLEDYKDYHIYLVDDHPELLKEAKTFNKYITTILLQTKIANRIIAKNDFEADKVVHKLEEILPIILSN